MQTSDNYVKILFLDIFRPLNFFTGSYIHKLELIRNLALQNNELYIITVKNAPCPQGEHIIPITIPVNNPFFLYLSYICIIVYLTVHRKIDILYTRSHVYGYLGLVLGNLTGKKIVCEVNSLTEDEYALENRSSAGKKFPLSRKVNKKIASMAEKSLILHADRLIAVTEGIMQYIIQHYKIDPNKISVVNNGANIELFKPIPQDEARDVLNLNKNQKYICFTGNFAPWQGIEFLLLAAHLISQNEPDVNYLLVGGGPLENILKDRTHQLGLNGKVTFTGAVQYEMVPFYINSSDICVAPFIKQRNEKIGLSPLKIFEYLACQKPVISCKIPGIIQIMNESKALILVDPENSEQLADALLYLLHNVTERERMGRDGREYVIRYHSWNRVAASISALFRDLMT